MCREKNWIIKNNQVYVIEKDSSSRSGVRHRKGCINSCLVCSRKFAVRLRHGDQQFCSIECRGVSRRKRKSVICNCCNTRFEKTPSKIELSKSGYHFCSRLCKDKFQSSYGNYDNQNMIPDHYGTSYTGYAQYCKGEGMHFCCGCGEPREILLCVHHIDGDRKNNAKENLEIVCANCHKIRHLKQTSNGNWIYCTSALTPRNLLSDF